MEWRKPSNRKLVLLLRESLAVGEVPEERWNVVRYTPGLTHKREPVILVELKHRPAAGAEVEAAHAFVALHPKTWKIYGVRHVLKRPGYTDVSQPEWFNVSERGRGVGTLLMAHTFEKAREWRQNVHVSSDVLNPGFFRKLMELGVEKVRGRREAYLPRENLTRRPWKKFLLRPSEAKPERRRH